MNMQFKKIVKGIESLFRSTAHITKHAHTAKPSILKQTHKQGSALQNTGVKPAVEAPYIHGEFNPLYPLLPNLEAERIKADAQVKDDNDFSPDFDIAVNDSMALINIGEHIRKEKEWIAKVQAFPAINEATVKNLVMTEGANLDPTQDYDGDRQARYAFGRVAQWTGEACRVDLPEGKFFALKPGNYVAITQSIIPLTHNPYAKPSDWNQQGQWHIYDDGEQPYRTIENTIPSISFSKEEPVRGNDIKHQISPTNPAL